MAYQKYFHHSITDGAEYYNVNYTKQLIVGIKIVSTDNNRWAVVEVFYVVWSDLSTIEGYDEITKEEYSDILQDINGILDRLTIPHWHPR